MKEPHITAIREPGSGLLLHQIIRANDSSGPIQNVRRSDLSEPQEFLQAALISIPKDHSFRPHIHLERNRTLPNLRAQESWVVIRGEVLVDYYGETGEFLLTEKLQAGDATISFRGGHGYRTLTSDALVFEFKSGPYEGLEIDKSFI